MRKDNGYRDILKTDEHLKIFMDRVENFNQQFSDAMGSGDDFTLTLEVRGNGGNLIHARMKSDRFDRPEKIKQEMAGRKLPEPK